MTRSTMEALIARHAAEIGQLRTAVDRLTAENAVLRLERDEARRERDEARRERDEARRERDTLRQELTELRLQHTDLQRRVSALLAAIQTSDERLRRLVRREFGATSERTCADQQWIPEIAAAIAAIDQELATAVGATTDVGTALTPTGAADAPAATTPPVDAAAAQGQTRSGRRRPAKAGGRLPLPADIERRTTTYTPPEDHPALRHALRVTAIGTTDIERWSIGSPDLHIAVTTCPVVRLELPGGIVTQVTLTPPSVIERGQVSDELLIQSAVDTVVDHLPAHRQEQRVARLGAAIPRSKLCRWQISLAGFLAPVAEAIFDEIRAEPVIGIDDTVHRLQVDDRRVCQQARMWAVTAPIGAYYLFSPTREGVWISDLLQGYAGGVMGDAYAGHRRLLATPQITTLFCWAHVRRKFVESDDPQRRQVMLDLIGKLYAIEADLRDATPDQRIFRRTAAAKPILTAIGTTLDQWAGDPRILPKSGIGMAIAYARKLWPGLVAYTTIGTAPIDNNATERAIRPIALHRGTSLFSASEAGAEAYATLLTITRTALLHDLEPIAYLREIVGEMHYGRNIVNELTPARYAARKGLVGKRRS